MTASASIRASCKADANVKPHRHTLASCIAIVAGLTFTVASAATNLTYATAKATTPPEQVIWGAVAVAASIGLALAPSAVLSALSARRFGAAILATLAMFVFGAYSVTAALGSATGGRLVAGADSSDVATKRLAATDTIARATKELASVEVVTIAVRTVAEIEAEISKQLASRRDLDDCTTRREHPNARAVCAIVADLRAERGRAVHAAEIERRRAELDRTIAEARAILASLPSRGTVANTDAVALQGFLAAMGITASTDALNRLLVVLAVLVIELGGGLAFAVGQGLVRTADENGNRGTPAPAREPNAFATPTDPCVTANARPNTANACVSRPLDGLANTGNVVPMQPVRAASRHEVADRLLNLVREHGGRIEGSVRSLASAIGTTATTMHGAAGELADAGLLVIEAGRNGSVYRLVSAA